MLANHSKALDSMLHFRDFCPKRNRVIMGIPQNLSAHTEKSPTNFNKLTCPRSFTRTGTRPGTQQLQACPPPKPGLEIQQETAYGRALRHLREQSKQLPQHCSVQGLWSLLVKGTPDGTSKEKRRAELTGSSQASIK